MKVEGVRKVEEPPFVCITLTREEAKILFELVNGNINELRYYGQPLNLPMDANETFAAPLFTHLENLGIE
jgi:hypothetical protein